MKREQGFTLMEIIVASSLVLLLALAIGNFAQESLRLNRNATERLNAEFANIRVFRQMLQELRSASSIGAVSTSSLSFVANLGEEPETISYYLEPAGATLWREASGSLRELVSHIENGSTTPIFGLADGLVEVVIISHGKEHSFKVMPRNLNQ